MEQKKIVLDTLEQAGIPYRFKEHPAIFTVEEMEAAHVDDNEEIPKNLFLRDDKGKRHFIVALKKHKAADLKALREKLGCRPLSFASEGRLMQYLGLTKGSVSVFGVLNDESRTVEVVIDSDLKGCPSVGFHANRNTATVFLSMDDVEQIIRAHGNVVAYVEV